MGLLPGSVLFLSVLSFSLRLGSLDQLDRLCRRQRRSSLFGRILAARQPALLLTDTLLAGLLLLCGRMAARQPELIPFLRPHDPSWTAHVLAGVRTAGLVILIWIVWLAVPRAIARSQGGIVLYRLRGIVFLSARAARPLWIVTERIDRLIARLTGAAETESRSDRALIDEIMALVHEAQRQQAISAGGSRMIHGLLDLPDSDVASVMTPRIDLVTLNAGTTLYDAARQIVRSGYSRFPVVRDTVDDVIGVLYARDLLRCVTDGADMRTETIDGIIRPAMFVPESQHIDALIDDMQERKIQMAVVVDEYSGIAGVVTMEDIMEEIFGEITDEFDPDERELIRQFDGIIEADARAHIDDLNSEFRLGLPEGADYDTLNGFLLSQFGRIPHAGESHQWRDIRLTVLDADERQLRRVRLERIEDHVPLTEAD